MRIALAALTACLLTVCGAIVIETLMVDRVLAINAGDARVGSALPSVLTAKSVLNATHHHGEWVRVTVGEAATLAWVVYPDRPDPAPIAFLTARGEGLTDWLRAAADQFSVEGYVAVVPDVLIEVGPVGGYSDSEADAAAMSASMRLLGASEARRRIGVARAHATQIGPSSGRLVEIQFDRRTQTVHVSTDEPQLSRDFELSPETWADIVAFANTVSRNTSPREPRHGMHAGMAPLDTRSTAARQAPAARQLRYPIGKPDHLPAGLFNAASTVARSTMRAEWVDIPFEGQKLHTRVVYPPGTGPAGVVILMQHGPGFDDSMLAYADQLARDGFIAVGPDLHSGLGPNGGNLDSFKFTDDVFKATAQLTAEGMQARYKAARDYALKLPRANGKTASMGFCLGGTNSWRFASEIPDLSAAVVFYGNAPQTEVLTKIKAPVIGFYGEDDARLTSTVAGTAAEMTKLGKSFEHHIYSHATHGFLYFQDLAGNPEATEHSWPRAVAFLREYLR